MYFVLKAWAQEQDTSLWLTNSIVLQFKKQNKTNSF